VRFEVIRRAALAQRIRIAQIAHETLFAEHITDLLLAARFLIGELPHLLHRIP
jgi:hypothetical protein